jgi:hypothetical protein
MTEQMKMDGGKSGGPVECLGVTFPSDDARRAHFLTLLAEKLKDPAFRNQEGFPQGSDDAILAMSDPPYYTACPNPFLSDFVNYYSSANEVDDFDYAREPFAGDVSEGKSDPIYGAHTYHTKVPPKAIARYILHYTKPGDLVLDGFSGTGMTGVAAQLCDDSRTVHELGYRVESDGTISQKEIENGQGKWRAFSKIGPRIPILNDLSPVATFITNNYGRLFDVEAFYREAQCLDSNIKCNG